MTHWVSLQYESGYNPIRPESYNLEMLSISDTPKGYDIKSLDCFQVN